jgi:hypothetical protein
MELSPATESLLSELDSYSGGKITCRPDLGLLLDSGRVPPGRQMLQELAFYSKFIHQTYGIMTRIGRDGQGYDRLAKEFTDAVGKTRTLLTSLIAGSPDHVRASFAATYLDMTHEGLNDLLALCHDLSWYKNWLLDTGHRRKGAS